MIIDNHDKKDFFVGFMQNFTSTKEYKLVGLFISDTPTKNQYTKIRYKNLQHLYDVL